MGKILKSFRLYIFTYDWEVVEIMGATIKIGMGFWLLLPFQSFKNGGGITSVGAENIWGWALLILGVTHMVAIRAGRIKYRRIMTFIAFLFWLFTILITIQATITSPLIPFYGTIAFFMAMNFIRISVFLPPDVRVTNLGKVPASAERRQ